MLADSTVFPPPFSARDKTADVLDILKLKFHRSGSPPGLGSYDLSVDINDDTLPRASLYRIE